MAREAIPVENTRQAANLRRYTVSDANTIPKYTLMFLQGDNTASASTTTSSGALFAGITVFEKTASDGQTEITCDIGGVWDITASGTIPLGSLVVLANGENYVQDSSVSGATAAAQDGIIVGMAMEAGSAAEVIRVDLDRH